MNIPSDVQAALIAELNRLVSQWSKDDHLFTAGEELEDLLVYHGLLDAQVDEDCFEDFDGQPDEAQEWHDFDPDC